MSLQPAIVDIKDIEAFQNTLKAYDCNAYLIIDAARVENPAVIKEFYKPSSLCLFDGAASRNSRDVAPHMISWSELNPSAYDALWSELRAGQGITVGSPLSPQQLKRRLRVYLQVRDDKNVYFAKYYTAINFLYFMKTEAKFSAFIAELTYVICRSFRDRNDFAVVEPSSVGEA